MSEPVRRVAARTAVLPDGVTPAGTRGRVLAAALELFAETGYHGTSIRDIAQRVGINSATLYSHYPSKEHLLAELVHLGHEALYARLGDALRRATDPPGQLRELVAEHVLVHADYPLLAVVCNHEYTRCPPHWPRMRWRYGTSAAGWCSTC